MRPSLRPRRRWLGIIFAFDTALLTDIPAPGVSVDHEACDVLIPTSVASRASNANSCGALITWLAKPKNQAMTVSNSPFGFTDCIGNEGCYCAIRFHFADH